MYPKDYTQQHQQYRFAPSILSYSYTLLYHDIVAVLHTRGLDPGLGLLHETENGRWSLALDFMEPFRPAIGDALTIRLLGHRILQAADFEPLNEGIYLSKTGRKKLVLHYKRRMDRPFLSEHIGHRTTLRQAIVDFVVAYKSSLNTGETLSPFRIN